MNDSNLLEQLFGDKLIKSEMGDYGKHCIKLNESSDYFVTINNVAEIAIAIKTDNFPDLKNFFNCCSDIGQCKRADFVVVTDKKLIFIELCKGKKQAKEVVQQLKGAQCVIEYCRNIGSKFYDYDSFLQDYSSYFVSFSKIGSNKKTIKITKGINNNPDKFLKINSPNNMQFNQLCCK